MINRGWDINPFRQSETIKGWETNPFITTEVKPPTVPEVKPILPEVAEKPAREGFFKDLLDSISEAGADMWDSIRNRFLTLTMNRVLKPINVGDPVPGLNELYTPETATIENTKIAQEKLALGNMYEKNLRATEAWKSTHPERQPVYPEGFYNTVKKNPKTLLDATLWAETIGQTMPYTVGLMGIALLPQVGIPATFLITAATEGQEIYEDAKANGASDEQAEILAEVFGSLSAIVETVGDAVFVKGLGGVGGTFSRLLAKQVTSEVATEVIKKTGWQVTKEIVGRALLDFLNQGGQEYVEQVLRNAAVKFVNNNRPLLQDAFASFVSGVVGTIPFVGAGAVGQFAQTRTVQEAIAEARAEPERGAMIPGAEPRGIPETVKPEVTKPVIFGTLEDRLIEALPTLKRPSQTDTWEIALIDLPNDIQDFLLFERRKLSLQGQRLLAPVKLKNGMTIRIDVSGTREGLLKRLIIDEPEVAIPKAEVGMPEAVTPTAPAVETTAIPPTEQLDVNEIQERGRIDPASVSPQEAKVAHTELGNTGAPPPTTIGGVPVVSPEGREPSNIIKDILDKATKGERPDQTLLRLHEGAINAEQNRIGIIIQEGGEKLKALGIGIKTRGQLVVMPRDIARMDELYNALHNPSKVVSGEIKIPQGLEDIYNELRGLTDWEQSARLDFDPEMATIEDYFYRGWKPPEGSKSGMVQGRPLVRTPSFMKPRVNASWQEMRELGFEPVSWNPYQQWGISRLQGIKYREQMELVAYLKGMGDEFARPIDGGVVPEGWRVPEVGPAFEGKPFATIDPVNNKPAVMFTRRWAVPENIANTLENIYGKKPSLGPLFIGGKKIDPMKIIDALTFTPKRAKLFGSFFQQIDFLTRAGAGAWSGAVDKLLAGHPIESVISAVRYPITAIKILEANFNPATRLSLAKQLDSTEPLIKGRPGIHFRGIVEAGLSTMNPTILPADINKIIEQIANETGVRGTIKGIGRLIGDIESAMRRGLFQGTYPATITTSIKYNIAPMVVRQFGSLNDAQINGEIARLANMMHSTIPASQSVIQNRVLRETLRRVFFSWGETESWLRQASGAIKGPYASFWRKYYIGAYLFLILTANIIHFASTGKPLPKERYLPISKTSYGPLPFGYNTQFAAPTIPLKGRGGVELTLDLVGQMDTAFRVLNPGFFLTSRESVPIRALVNQVNGTDFYGAPIDDVGPGGIISRVSQLLYDLFAPIGLGGLIPELGVNDEIGMRLLPRGEDRLGITGLAIQATGLNLRAETTLALLDRVAKESGLLKADGTPVEKWDDLEPYQKNDLSNNEQLQTELGLRSEAAVERQQLKAFGFATLDDLDKERVVRGEALVTEFITDSISLTGQDYSQRAKDFQEQVKLLKREISSRKAQVDYDFGLFKDTGKLPTDPNKKALVEYYNIFELAKRPSGEIDWDKQERLETILRKQWTPAQDAYVDRNIGITEWGSLMTEYIKDMEYLKDYWEIPKGENQAKQRMAYRLANPDIDAILIRWYGYKPAKLTTPSRVSSFSISGGNPFGR